ncbi:hypothetical protein GCM10010413_37080 [Promicromonospora sukumoe]
MTHWAVPVLHGSREWLATTAAAGEIPWRDLTGRNPAYRRDSDIPARSLLLPLPRRLRLVEHDRAGIAVGPALRNRFTGAVACGAETVTAASVLEGNLATSVRQSGPSHTSMWEWSLL